MCVNGSFTAKNFSHTFPCKQIVKFAVQMRMLTALAFIPEIDVIDCFIILMSQFPPIAMEIAEYFEINYIGRRLPDQSRRTPPYPIIIWNIYYVAV